jgi:NO-binding membrane sensor protein with MHYT domain
MVVRVLGLREAAQSLVSAPRPTAAVLRVGAGLDTLHAVTMLALATRSITWRRPALGSAVVAATFAVQALGDAQRLPPTTGASLRPIAGTAAGLLDLRDRCALTVLHAAPPVVDGARTHRGGVR